MSLVVTCSGCGTRLRAPADSAGKSVKCPKCGKAIGVPSADQPAVAEQPAVPSAFEVVEDVPDNEGKTDKPRPARRKRERDEDEGEDNRRSARGGRGARSGVPAWVWLLGGTAAVLLTCCCGGVAFMGWAGKKAGDPDSSIGAEHKVGDTIEFGDLAVTIESATVVGFLSETKGGGRIMTHPESLMVKLRIKNRNPNRVIKADSQAGKCSGTDDVGNSYESLRVVSDLGLESRVEGRISEGYSVEVRSEQEATDILILPKPVAGASKVTVLFDARCYGGDGKIKLVITRGEWKWPPDPKPGKK